MNKSCFTLIPQIIVYIRASMTKILHTTNLATHQLMCFLLSNSIIFCKVDINSNNFSYLQIQFSYICFTKLLSLFLTSKKYNWKKKTYAYFSLTRQEITSLWQLQDMAVLTNEFCNLIFVWFFNQFQNQTTWATSSCLKSRTLGLIVTLILETKTLIWTYKFCWSCFAI